MIKTLQQINVLCEVYYTDIYVEAHQLCSSKCHSIDVWFYSYSLSIIGDGRGSSSVKIKWQYSRIMHLSFTIPAINIHELPPVLSIIIVVDFSGLIILLCPSVVGHLRSTTQTHARSPQPPEEVYPSIVRHSPCDWNNVRNGHILLKLSKGICIVIRSTRYVHWVVAYSQIYVSV